MKVDLYTKGVLTVIASCLVILVLNNISFFPKTYANEKEFLIPNNNVNYGLVPLNEDGSINVKLDASSVIDVNIEEIGGQWVKHSNGKLIVYSEEY